MIRGRIHTDLALEAKERYEEDNVEIRGVCIEEEYNEEKDIRTTLVKIETENGARAMGRPQGSYLTLEAPNLSYLYRMRVITEKFRKNWQDRLRN